MVNAGKKSLKQLIYSTLWMALGAFLASFSLTVFLLPNEIIDGGVVGVSMLAAKIIGNKKPFSKKLNKILTSSERKTQKNKSNKKHVKNKSTSFLACVWSLQRVHPEDSNVRPGVPIAYVASAPRGY